MKTIKTILIFLLLTAFGFSGSYAGEISYQGRISQNNEQGGLFEGVNGYFKFAIVDSTGEDTYWSNDLSSIDGSEPDTHIIVPFPERNGVFQVSLGSSAMAPIGPEVFNKSETYLRIWFSPDGGVFEKLSPDEKISTVAYSFRSSVADTVSDGSLGFEKLSSDFSGMTVVSSDANDSKLKKRGFVRFGQITSQPWIRANDEDEPSPLVGHSSVSVPNSRDGINMIVWGGSPVEGFFSNVGWSYDSNADRWITISPLDSPSKRVGHSAVVYDGKMLVWGGLGESSYLNNGGIYSISENEWSPVAPGVQVITARREHSSVVASGKMIIWGGRNEFNVIGDGASYDFDSGQWNSISVVNSPQARTGHSASVYQDRLMIVFGGESKGGFLGDGAVYDVESGNWGNLTSSTQGPEPRAGHTAIVANDHLIIWGGMGSNGLIGDGYIFSFDKENADLEGAGSDISGVWTKLPTQGDPSPRIGHTANWTGSEMVLFGGESNFGVTNTGYAYDLSMNKWRSLTTKGGAISRARHTSEWTGSQLIIFGGIADGIRISDTQLLDTQRTWHLYRKL